MIIKELLDPLNLTKAQVFSFLKLVEIFVIYKDKNLVFTILSEIVLGIKSPIIAKNFE